MAELKIERDHPGRTARYWRDGDVVIVQLGEELTEIEERRVIREARREHGIRRRGILPIPLIPTRLRDAARDHPTTTAAVTGVLAAGVAAGAILGTGLSQPSDEPRPRRKRPPAAAGPSPTHSPTVPQPRRPTAGPSVAPGYQDGPARPSHPAAAVRPSSSPPTTMPPTSPPAEPPPTRPPARRCLVHLDALGLVDVRLLCS